MLLNYEKAVKKEGGIKRPESNRIPNSGLRSCLNYMSNFIGSDQFHFFTRDWRVGHTFYWYPIPFYP